MSKHKKLVKLPETIYVRIDRPTNDDPYLIASEDGVYGAMDGDGPEHIGVYKLAKTVEATRIISFHTIEED